jgi:hypothetical protein
MQEPPAIQAWGVSEELAYVKSHFRELKDPQAWNAKQRIRVLANKDPTPLWRIRILTGVLQYFYLICLTMIEIDNWGSGFLLDVQQGRLIWFLPALAKRIRRRCSDIVIKDTFGSRKLTLS